MILSKTLQADQGKLVSLEPCGSKERTEDRPSNHLDRDGLSGQLVLGRDDEAVSALPKLLRLRRVTSVERMRIRSSTIEEEDGPLTSFHLFSTWNGRPKHMKE